MRMRMRLGPTTIMVTLLTLGVIPLPGCDEKRGDEKRSLQLRDPWQAQTDAAELLGAVAMCSGNAAIEKENSGGCTKITGASGGYVCQTMDSMVAICPPLATDPCKRVWRKPAERSVVP